MSCPKCGSGAVFQGRCRECGAIADARRASSVSVTRQPLDQDTDESTVLESRRRRPAEADADATRAPPQRRPASDDPDATRAGPSRSPPPPAEPEPKPKSKPAARRPTSSGGPPQVGQDRAAWYRAAGLPVPSEEPLPAPVAEALTGPHPVEPLAAAALVLFFQAAVDGAGVALGLSPIALAGAGLELVAGILLLRGAGIGRAMGWLCVLWSIAFALMLALLFKYQLMAVLKVVPSVALLAAMHGEGRGLRWTAAGVGVAFALTGLVATVRFRPPPLPRGADAPLVGAYSPADKGYTLKAPEGLDLYVGEKALRWLPGDLRATPNVVFSNADQSFVGGLVVVRQPPGIELSNLLVTLHGGSELPVRNARIVPDSLRAYEGEGYEIATPGSGTMLVVLARAPDGRSFALFGVSRTAALTLNQQLFTSLAWGLQIKRTVSED